MKMPTIGQKIRVKDIFVVSYMAKNPYGWNFQLAPAEGINRTFGPNIYLFLKVVRIFPIL